MASAFDWRSLIRATLAQPRGREQVERLALSLGIQPAGVSSRVLVDATARAIAATQPYEAPRMYGGRA